MHLRINRVVDDLVEEGVHLALQELQRRSPPPCSSGESSAISFGSAWGTQKKKCALSLLCFLTFFFLLFWFRFHPVVFCGLSALSFCQRTLCGALSTSAVHVCFCWIFAAWQLKVQKKWIHLRLEMFFLV